MHVYWKHRLAEHLRACGYEVVEEFPVGGGKAIDLVATRGGNRIAFEIETGSSEALGNVTKCLGAGMEEVIVVVTSPRERESLAKRLKAYPLTTVMTASEATKWPRSSRQHKRSLQ